MKKFRNEMSLLRKDCTAMQIVTQVCLPSPLTMFDHEIGQESGQNRDLLDIFPKPTPLMSYVNLYEIVFGSNFLQ